jgi:hypothetical protein
MRLIIEFSDRGFFEGAVHALDLAIGPGVIGFGQAMGDGVFIADPCKDVFEGMLIPFPVRELDAVIGQHDMDFIGHDSD